MLGFTALETLNTKEEIANYLVSQLYWLLKLTNRRQFVVENTGFTVTLKVTKAGKANPAQIFAAGY